jgi:hypothetical protein
VCWVFGGLGPGGARGRTLETAGSVNAPLIVSARPVCWGMQGPVFDIMWVDEGRRAQEVEGVGRAAALLLFVCALDMAKPGKDMFDCSCPWWLTTCSHGLAADGTQGVSCRSHCNYCILYALLTLVLTSVGL